MSAMFKRIRKFKEIYKIEGLQATLEYTLNFFVAKTGWFKDKPYFASFIEKRGNIAKLNGCKFDLSSPLISRKIKSRFILGRYEKEERKAIRKFLDPTLAVIELGASIGVVSCVTNKTLKNPKDHVVIEANPDLIPLLQKNRDINGCGFSIVNKAVSYSGHEATFYIHERFLSGSAHRETGKFISVPSITLSEIFNEYRFPKANLICDIEGGEVDLIQNEKNIIAEKVFQIIIEVHPSVVGEEKIEYVKRELESVGFRKIRTGTYSGIYSPVWVFQNSKIAI